LLKPVRAWQDEATALFSRTYLKRIPADPAVPQYFAVYASAPLGVSRTFVKPQNIGASPTNTVDAALRKGPWPRNQRANSFASANIELSPNLQNLTTPAGKVMNFETVKSFHSPDSPVPSRISFPQPPCLCPEAGQNASPLPPSFCPFSPHQAVSCLQSALWWEAEIS
jgi:hypothetical protein